MSFTLERGCSDVIVTAFENIAILIMWATSNEIDGTVEDYGIAIGDNGVILVSRGRDTINFQPVNSGTTQDLKSAVVLESKPAVEVSVTAKVFSICLR